MKYLGKDIDFSKYQWVDEFRKGINEYRAINPENLTKSNNHNTFYLKTTIWTEDTHIGELLGYIIAKKNGIKVCDAELYKTPSSSDNTKFIHGVISYVDKNIDEQIIPSGPIIRNYLQKINFSNKLYGNIDIETIFNAVFDFMNRHRRPYQEFLEFKQDFINMAVWDIKNMNPDRRMDNWFFRVNERTGKTDLYPMFDNEMILGFDEMIGKSEYSQEELSVADKKRKSAILTPEDIMKKQNYSDYEKFFNFLLLKYPIQTRKAFESVNNFTLEDLEDTLENIEGISKTRKKKVIQLFNKRTEQLNKIFEKNRINEKDKMHI